MQSTFPAKRMEQFSGLMLEINAASAEPSRWPATVGV